MRGNWVEKGALHTGVGQSRPKHNGRCGMEEELQGLQAGEERSGSNASQVVECCLETMVEQIFAVGTDQAKSKFDARYQKILKRFETPTPPA